MIRNFFNEGCSIILKTGAPLTERRFFVWTLLYFWLSSPEFAMSRVAERVKKGDIVYRMILLNAGIFGESPIF